MHMNPNTNDAWKNWSNKNLKTKNFQVLIGWPSIKHQSSQAKPDFDPVDKPCETHDDRNQSCIPNTSITLKSLKYFFQSCTTFLIV